VDTVVIEVSKFRAITALLLACLCMVIPITLFVSMPHLFKLSSGGLTSSITIYGLPGLVFIIGGVLAVVALKILNVNSGLELSEKGIRSNVSGFSEKRLQANNIHEAVVKRNGNGGTALMVLKKEGLEEYLENPPLLDIGAPALRVWFYWLKGNANDLANTINQYYALNEAAASTGMTASANETPPHQSAVEPDATNAANNRIYSGLAVITIGVFVHFGSVPNWAGMGLGLFIVLIGWIIAGTSKDQVTLRQLPKHLATIFCQHSKKWLNVLTAPTHSVLNRLAGAVVYPVVGTPILFFVLPYLNGCRWCDKPYDVAVEYLWMIFLPLTIVGYAMGIGRAKTVSDTASSETDCADIAGHDHSSPEGPGVDS